MSDNVSKITENELCALKKYFAPPSGHFLEIGTSRGGTAKLMGEAFPDRTIVTVDHVSHPEVVELPCNVIRIIGDSYNVGRQLSGIMTNMFRLIFIDGDHRYNYVKRDATIYEQYLEWGGWMAFHDSSNPDIDGVHGHLGVMQAIKELLETKRWKRIDVIDSITFLKKDWKVTSFRV